MDHALGQYPRSVEAESSRKGLQRGGLQALQGPVQSLSAPEVGRPGSHPQSQQKNSVI
jgi:hypothetical protein